MRAVAFVISLLLTGIFCLWCVQHHAPRIQSSLQGSANNALAAIALPGLSAVADGRDITLEGVVGSAEIKERVGAEVAAIRGVRVVDNQLDVSALPSPEFRLTFDRGIAVLAGLVPSADIRSQLVARAGELFGTDRVRDELTVGETVDLPWIGRLLSALTAFREADQGLMSTGFDAVDNLLTLTGVVPAADARSSIETAFRSALPDIDIDNRIEVVAPEAQISEMLELENIEFETDSDQLTARGRDVVERVRAVLAQIGDFDIEIAGHTDSIGDAAYNLDLSQRRARTVLATLAETLPRDSFSARGYGETQPTAENDTPEGRQKNRRIEFRILEETAQ